VITGRIARQLAEHLAPFPVGVGKFDARYTAIFRRMASFGMHKILSRAEVSFRGLNRRVAEQQLNLLKLAARSAAQLRACTPEVMWRDTGIPRSAAFCRSICQTTFSPSRSPVTQPPWFTGRNT
jgi:hypothetical protein